jgi:Sulfatase
MPLKNILQRIPLFLVLLPVFFVLHGFKEDFGYIDFSDCLLLMAIYSGLAISLFLIFFLFFRAPVKAALLSAYLIAFYLFFGAMHEFLGSHSISHRYGLVFSGFVMGGILLCIWLKRRQHFRKPVYFLNLLLLVYLLIDTASIVRKSLSNGISSIPSYSKAGSVVPCDTCRRPDIYLLVFDEYSGSGILKNFYHYDNSSLDSFLTGEGFSIQKKSRSNYNMTPFSMASLLNFSYLKGIPEPDSLTWEDYKKINLSVKNGEVISILSSLGYKIVNYSPFDLQGSPSIQQQPFLPHGTMLITDNTLPHYFENELSWVFGKWLAGRHIIAASHISQPHFSAVGENNDRMLTLAKEESRKKSDRPRFVYVHLFMPHYPYLFDSRGRRRNTNDAPFSNNDTAIQEYLGYLPHTNACARDLVSAIKQNTGGKAVILFMSDHGFRLFQQGRVIPNAFYNQNAVYFPDKDYSLFNDSITGVNQFRVVFNKLFRQNLPYLKDSILFLRDKN